MIRGFPAQPTVQAGAEVVLHVSTDAPQFRVDFYRWGGGGLSWTAGSGWLDGCCVPDHLPHQDWSVAGVGLHGEELEPWPGHSFPVSPDWRPGVYVAVLTEGDGRGQSRTWPQRTLPEARDGQALFVVGGLERRPSSGPAARAGAPILYKVPLLTYAAYNEVSPQPYDVGRGQGGWCLYTVPRPELLPAAVPPSVSLRRPGGGTGGTPWDVANFDPFDPTPRQTFVHWDAPFLGWLERHGFRVDYCTDLDLHRAGPELLRRHRLLVSAGHDEYWSDAMRAAVEGFVATGGNVAFFGGNTCWWRVSFDDDASFRRTGFWWECDRPENSLTGVSFRNGGERDRNDHPVPVGYQVQHADHWVFAGTGLVDGEVIGARPDEYVVGYECDGAHFDRTDLGRGLPVNATGDDGTPADFTILGLGDAAESGWGLGNRAATMGLYTRGGTVFNAATTDWARVLADGRSPVIEQITANVLDRLGGAADPGHLRPVRAGRPAAGG